MWSKENVILYNKTLHEFVQLPSIILWVQQKEGNPTTLSNKMWVLWFISLREENSVVDPFNERLLLDTQKRLLSLLLADSGYSFMYSSMSYKY